MVMCRDTVLGYCAGILCYVISPAACSHCFSIMSIHFSTKFDKFDMLYYYSILKLGLRQICWHNFEHNRLANYASIIRRFSRFKIKAGV